MAGALDGIRVVEVGQGKAVSYAGKLLRDLGAEVIKIEPPGGDALREYGPFPSDEPDPERSGMFIFLNGGKGGLHLDLETADGRAGLVSLLDGADVLLHSFQPAEAQRLGLEPDALLERHPRLIVSAITPYGSTGPYAEWRGYALQAVAGSGVALRVGELGREPLTLPLDQADIQHGAVQAAAATTLALLHRNRTGRGQFVDVGVLDCLTYGVSGITFALVLYFGAPPMVRAGRRFGSMPWGVMETRDGDFDAITLIPRQWEDFIKLMGSPEWADEPAMRTLDTMELMTLQPEQVQARFDYIEDWFKQRTRAEIWEQTKEARISFQPVHRVGEVVDSDQITGRGFIVPAPGPHPPLRVPGAPYRMSVTPWAAPGAPPALDGPPATGWESAAPAPREAPAAAGDLPLEGVRVIDLGQVWAGPLLVRYLADYGADVITVETESRPRALPQIEDQSQPGNWEGLYRNRRSVKLDLRKPCAVELFKGLLREADVLVDNFTPEVLPRFGLDYEEMAAEHPRLIIAALSAAGQSGPWANLLTYGPSLTALYGMKSVNGYPEGGVMEDASELDPISAGYGMLAIMAALHHRDRTGQGQMIEVAQGEVGVLSVTEAVIEHVWNGRDMGPQGNLHRVLAPHGIYPCAGDDRWIAIACGSDEEWRALARAAGHAEWLEQEAFRTAAGRRAARTELDSAISAWTQSEEPEALTQRLQQAGVAALPAMGLLEILGDPQHNQRRDYFRLGDDFPGDRLNDGNAWHLSAAPPLLRHSSPAPGQHSEEVFGELLGLSAEEVHGLQEEGVIG